MSSNTVRISLADLASAGVLLSHSNAVTIAREAALRSQRGVFAGIPSPDDLRLSSDGEIENVGTAAQGNEIRRAARLLAALLANAEQDVTSPATFRLILARAFADDEAAYESVDQFLAALAPFAATDPGGVVRNVVEAWRSKIGVGDSLDEFAPEPAPITRAAVPVAGAIAAFHPDPAPVVKAVVHPDPAPGFVQESVVHADRGPVRKPVVHADPGPVQNPVTVAAEKSVAVERPVAVEKPIAVEQPVAVEKPVPAEKRVPAVAESQRLRTASGDAIIGTQATRQQLGPPGVGSAEPSRYSRRWIPTLAAAALLTAVLPAFWSWSRSGPDPAVDAQAAPSNQGTSSKPDNATPPSVAEPQSPAVPPPGSSPSEKVQQGPTAAPSPAPSTEKKPPPPPPPPTSVATSGGSTPGGTTATEVIREAAFSPSFASAASGMFYHSGTGPGSAIMRADTDGAGMVLRVTSVVDDRGSNFHPRPSPDGQLLAFDSDRDGERGIYVANSNGRDVRRVSGPGFAAVPSWSPDGRRLAFARAEEGKPRVWNIWTVDMSTGKTSRITTHHFGQPWGAAWFPEGERIAYSHEDRLIVRTLQGKDVRVFKSPVRGRVVRTPAVSPDGKRIIFQVRRDGAWMLDLPSGSMSRVLEDPSAEEFTWSPDGKRVAYHSRRSGAWGVWMMAPR